MPVMSPRARPTGKGIFLVDIEKPARHLPVLVAHRGYALHYPENTVPSLQAAFRAGAVWVEFDIQLSADGVPVLIHDPDLRRTAGKPGSVLNRAWSEFSGVQVNEAERLGNRFHDVCIPTLRDAVALLLEWPGKQAFVELKTESLDRFGAERVVERVIPVLEPVRSRCVIISFDRQVLDIVRARDRLRIGWVLGKWDGATREVANRLAPDYLFCNHKRVPEAAALWDGPWQWVLYDAITLQQVLALGRRGAHFVETTAIGEVLNGPGSRAEAPVDG